MNKSIQMTSSTALNINDNITSRKSLLRYNKPKTTLILKMNSTNFKDEDNNMIEIQKTRFFAELTLWNLSKNTERQYNNLNEHLKELSRLNLKKINFKILKKPYKLQKQIE